MFSGMSTTLEQPGITQATFDTISRNLANIGALSLQQYLDDETNLGLAPHSHISESPSPPTPSIQEAPSQVPVKPTETPDANAVTCLHQACQRVFRNTDVLKFEFVEQNGSASKQCILTITKPDGVKRSYATRPVFTKKNEAKAEAARIAIEMGALEFLAGGEGGPTRPKRTTSNTGVAAISGSVPSTSESEAPIETSFIDKIERCCIEWRARRVVPFWIAFFEAKLGHKQGCALRIQLSPHVVRVYLSEPTFDTYEEAKSACAKAAFSEGVLDFIQHGNGQTRPTSPTPSSSSATTECEHEVNTRMAWTLQKFYESLPRPFPESFDTSDASEINAPGWVNTMVQNAKGGKLMTSFFFTSNGTRGLHGCLLKLDRPEGYRAYLVDPKFPKRSDAKAAVCLHAMSQGVGDYIRSITSAVESKVTPMMRTFSSSQIYPVLTSELHKIADDLQPRIVYDRERDAFGATLVVQLSTEPAPEQVQSYHIPCDYRNKADAKVAVICLAAEQGVIEFVCFRGRSPPLGYVSPYKLHSDDPEASRKRKQPSVVEDLDQVGPARKKKKGKHREMESQGSSSRRSGGGSVYSIHEGSHQTHGVPGPGDIGPTQGIHSVSLSDQSQSGHRNEGGSGAVRSAAYSYDTSSGPQRHVAPYPFPDLHCVGLGLGQGSALAYAAYSSTVGAGGSRPTRHHNAPLADQRPSYVRTEVLSNALCHSTEQEDLEPGEVVSSAESEFAGASCREKDSTSSSTQNSATSVPTTGAPYDSQDEDKEKVTSIADTARDEQSTTYTSHMKRLIDDCVQNRREAPTFHHGQSKSDDKFEAWIVIGKERFDLPRTYATAEEGWQRVAKQVLARLSKHG